MEGEGRETQLKEREMQQNGKELYIKRKRK